MAQQQTLKGTASFAGIGLHSGNRVSMTFLPAPPNTGIRFRRVDLEGKPEIEAIAENVVDNNRSTTLARGHTRVHTVEHVLATFAGYGIDNAIVELDANEPPIGDGSAREYCKLIQEAGIVPQDERRECYKVTEPIQLEMGETVMTLFPDEAFRISCTSADKQGRFTQFYSVELTPTTWERDLAHARTFCFYEEIAYLINHGLIKGGSLENAVVIRDDAVLTTEPLRYPDEFVRHKILDIVGDLALLGRPLRGHLVAVRPGHAANCELLRRIIAQMRKPVVAAQTFAPPPPAPKTAPPPAAAADETQPQESAIDIQGVMKLLPHRYPFLMVDRVAKIEGSHIIGIKNVSINEAYFQGHFPGHPVMPGVLQLEAIAQVAGIIMMKSAENAGKIAYFMSAEDVKWRKPVLPGDVLVIDVEMTKIRGKIGKAKGVCKVAGEVVSEAAVTFMLAEP
ncbi:MAG TPA: bifunctional UDP-3-O-[3-hydroxymyristoyl] N-acetylglucosamine deacetylase/3-hydroxyacyl-ACP dehydratase [Verrucomicrobiota bacterium]|nr:bifunctional UDP-3-O-[3-hydroxymyristoyl] N-acetylglucosamine deacetylase/3-hydroxyacyl-ACP dehydratase [Verrucomicrobiota bacterium]HCL91529.1 3-hydroxyacyl-[acyl-carrier-protein] dehydratase FabZ [Limisphaerales bacterium]HRR65123.1 bifunctional UDP-3-O-[3-hydroxymyristoyl] N-acetylglucosamine deacetylase/3-hydroxyacyl-ACP dehydratase [Candidatus Paceibacterota bacterium]MBP8014707.1 bifunctional UDP-3-O-[3-hydroxymyristoyl] N-acetylglucosamine deacetylase/3-hydroxyacyl-ACP dehydratase [Ver